MLLVEDTADKIKSNLINEKQHSEKYNYEEYDNYYINPLDDIWMDESDISRILNMQKEDEE